MRGKDVCWAQKKARWKRAWTAPVSAGTGADMAAVFDQKQDFRFHRFLAEHALQLCDLGARGSQFACRHDRFAGLYRHQGAFALELAPIEQLPGTDAVLARDQRHAHSWLVRFFDQRSLFLH
ncbi:MAG: hypothetical protein V7631_3031 [Massilia sp.]